jgi:hypothetical protein
MECKTQVEVKWSVSTAWADAGESAYLPRERGGSIILSKDRRVKQRWRRSGRVRKASRRSRRGSRRP